MLLRTVRRTSSVIYYASGGTFPAAAGQLRPHGVCVFPACITRTRNNNYNLTRKEQKIHRFLVLIEPHRRFGFHYIGGSVTRWSPRTTISAYITICFADSSSTPLLRQGMPFWLPDFLPLRATAHRLDLDKPPPEYLSFNTVTSYIYILAIHTAFL